MHLEKHGKLTSKTSPLFKYDIFVDKDGLMRIGGRLKHSELDERLKHPVILPKEGRVTELILMWCHGNVAHAGRGFTLNEIRQNGYWIIKGNALVKRLIYKCVTCRKLRGKLEKQKMADIPVDRTETDPPFTYCAVDFFGPFVVKERRSLVKRYGCIFTCMASRAIHLEAAKSLDTSSFLNALRRFIARRGNIRQLRSDQGTNFVGASSELKRAMEEMKPEAIQQFLTEIGTDYIVFKRNPPFASHQGGIWERQIRTVKSVLTALMIQHSRTLDDESFTTVLTEVEAIVNSRPLTVETINDPSSCNPITPNHLLTMKSKLTMPPPGEFSRVDLFCRNRWRKVQYIANQFWTRWKREYLQTLQARNTAVKVRRNFQVGDIVMIKDGQERRNQWPLARIVGARVDPVDGLTRKVTLMMPGSKWRKIQRDRAVNQLVLLVEADPPI